MSSKPIGTGRAAPGRAGRAAAAAAGAAMLLGVGAGSAGAAVITTTLHEFTGTDSSVQVTIDDEVAGAPNAVRFDLVVTKPAGLGDIRAVYFDVLNDALLTGLTVTNVAGSSAVTSFAKPPGGLCQIPGDPDTGLTGGGNPCPLDVGVEIGGPGGGPGDFFSTVSFLVNTSSGTLDVSQFYGQDMGLRLKSVGPGGGGSAKLEGSFGGPPPTPAPEPATLALLGVGMLGVAGAARRRRR